MAKIGKGQSRVLSGNNPELRINLKEMFGISMKGKPALREALGQALMDQMIERTQGGKDREGKSFKRYSKQYRNSDEYKASGKSGRVNMTLTGDMLGLLDIKDQSDNTITLGWDDSDEAAKAHGHITGDPNGPKVRRDFFGLNDSDISRVRKEFKDEIETIQNTRGSNREEAVLAFIQALKATGVADGEG